MTVKELAHLLDSLVLGLEQIKGGATIAKDAKVFANAMAPFSTTSIADFINFLGRCEEYQRTGILPIKQAGGKAKAAKVTDPNLIANEVARFKNLLNEINTGQVTGLRIQSLVKEFGKLTKPQLDEISAGLNIAGKAKTKPQALERIKQVLTTQLEMFDKARLIGNS